MFSNPTQTFINMTVSFNNIDLSNVDEDGLSCWLGVVNSLRYGKNLYYINEKVFPVVLNEFQTFIKFITEHSCQLISPREDLNGFLWSFVDNTVTALRIPMFLPEEIGINEEGTTLIRVESITPSEVSFRCGKYYEHPKMTGLYDEIVIRFRL